MTKYLQQLQITIFTRWCVQKLNSRHIKIKDCTKELDGITLVALLEVLSEQTYPKKMKPGKMKMQKIDNLNQALNWSFKKLGVNMKLKPSAENFFAGRVEQILGYLWTLFLKYTVIGDEDEDEKDRLSAEDSLLMWVQNQVKTYGNVTVKNLTKSFHNGLALCALIHKFRPKLIDYDSLGANNSKKNLQTAFDGAEKFFGLEQYLKPEDIAILSKKEMMIYISEYYYGIAEQRKHDLAARRIGKLIKYTETNDRLKAEYLVESQKLATTLDKIVKFLSDYTIDNTYSGAKKRAEDFDKYKATEKGEIGGLFLSLETKFNHIAMRLADHNRPAFDPKENSIQGFQELLKTIDKLEKEQNIRLHKELNRQEKLIQWNDLHKVNFEKLIEWSTKQQAYLKEKEDITSSGQAQYHINKLEGYRVECANIKNESGGQLKDLAGQLAQEKYEFIKKVDARIAQMEESFATLEKLANAKEPVLLDHLERNKYRESVLLEVAQHVDKFNKLTKWIKEKEAFLQKKEDINSISDAQLHLSLIGAYAKEKKGYTDVNIVSLTDLGKKILESEYKSDISQWVYEKPEEVQGRESEIDNSWNNLDELYASKLEILEDALALEIFKAQVRLMNSRHIKNFETLEVWIKEKTAYLKVKEVVDSSIEANKQLDTIDSYAQDKEGLTKVNVVSIKKLGEEIKNSLYKSKFNEWKFEENDKVTERETSIDDSWKLLDELYATKLAILKDDLARNLMKEMVNQKNAQHIAQFNSLSEWYAKKKEYLLVKEVINSIQDASTQLANLDVYSNEKKDVTSSNVTRFKGVGKFILESEYKTELSQFKFQTPEEIVKREGDLDNFWKELDELHATKLAILEDDKAREEFREALRLQNEQHILSSNELKEWYKTKDAYLKQREEIDSISDAQGHIGILSGYESEKKDLGVSNVSSWKALGKEIIDAEYKSDLSSFKFKTPEEIVKREGDLDADWKELDSLCAAKKEWLDEQLKIEILKEKLRLQYANLAGSFQRYVVSNNEKIRNWNFGFSLEDVQNYEKVLNAEEKTYGEKLETKEQQFQEPHNKLVEMKDTHINNYTELTLEDLAKCKKSLNDALGDRNGAWKTELARQIANDKLCEQFAKKAIVFVGLIEKNKDHITHSEEKLDEQLKFVEEKQESKDDAELPNLKALQDEMDEKKIGTNRHTVLNYNDCNTQNTQYKDFLTVKGKMLKEEIQNSLMRGITPEQYAEIEGQFKEFDKDNTQNLDKNEFKACLYSLNDERGKKEIAAIMNEYGSVEKGIDYDGFKEFMIKELGDAGTKEEVLEGFLLLAHGNTHVTRVDLEQLLEDHYLDYLAANAPPSENGYDYTSWSNDVYAR